MCIQGCGVADVYHGIQDYLREYYENEHAKNRTQILISVEILERWMCELESGHNMKPDDDFPGFKFHTQRKV